MQRVKILGASVIILMSVLMGNILIHDSFNTGIGMDRFIDALKDPWQAFIGFDMMSGLFLMFGWIVYRQKGERLIETLTWILLANWWGNIVVAAYILVALRQANGDAAKFFMGSRTGPLRAVWGMPSPVVKSLCILGAVSTSIYAALAMQNLEFTGLPAGAFIPAFAPIVVGFVLLAMPRKQAA